MSGLQVSTLRELLLQLHHSNPQRDAGATGQGCCGDELCISNIQGGLGCIVVGVAIEFEWIF